MTGESIVKLYVREEVASLYYREVIKRLLACYNVAKKIKYSKFHAEIRRTIIEQPGNSQKRSQ